MALEFGVSSEDWSPEKSLDEWRRYLKRSQQRVHDYQYECQVALRHINELKQQHPHLM